MAMFDLAIESPASAAKGRHLDMRKSWILLAVFSVVTSITAPCHAINFVLAEVPAGSSFPNGLGAAVAPDRTCMYPSTGDYAAAVRAAAVYWGTIYTQAVTITIRWGFSQNLPADTLGDASATSTITSGSMAGDVVSGVLRFNQRPSSCWYIDPDPTTFSEYPNGGTVSSEQIPYFNQPGKQVEVGRYTISSGGGNTGHADLFSSALHELGHLLGLTTGTWRYTNEVTDGDIDVLSPHPCPNLSWMSSGGHLTYSGNPRMLMFPSMPSGRRTWPSQADVSTIAQVSNWFVQTWGTGGGGVTGVAANNPPH
jgi:hypothetical protein